MTTHRIRGHITKGAFGIGPDEFKATLITGGVDLEKDRTMPGGVTPRSGTIPICLNHDMNAVIGKANYSLVNGVVEIVGTLLPLGTFDKADYARALIKGDFVTGVSAGFQPLKTSRNKDTGGVNFESYCLLEASLVTVPADPSARITQRAHDGERAARIERAEHYAKIGRQQRARELAGPPPALPSPPLTRVQRMALAAAVREAGEVEVVRAQLTPREASVEADARHFNAVLAGVREAHPTREQRLVIAERAAKAARLAGFG